MKPDANKKVPPGIRMTALIFLVIFVFLVLLISISAAAGFLFLMNHYGLLQPLSESRIPVMLAFLLVISLLIGTLITIFTVTVTLRPINKFIDTTSEIAAGNFNARFEIHGSHEYNWLLSSLNNMVEELSSIETLRDDFVSNISHEYKTPIVSIRGFAKLIKKGNLSQEQQDEYLDIIISEAERLTQLSNNVLLLSKLNNTEALSGLAEFPLDEQLRKAVVILDQQFDKKQIELEMELEPALITANEEMLQQVWINLLNNAIKFTPESGKISLRLSAAPGQVCVTVSDTGIGMEASTINHIFDKFYQGERSRSSEGNGLGLSLVKRIVELCNGTVEVTSEAGAGSAFTVVLPTGKTD